MVCASEVALLVPGSSAESTESGVDLLRLEGKELETTMVLWPPFDVECPCPWPVR